MMDFFFKVYSLLTSIKPYLLSIILLCLCFLLPLLIYLSVLNFPPLSLIPSSLCLLSPHQSLYYSFFSLSPPSLITNEDQSYFFFFIDFISIYNHLSVLLDPAVCQLLKFHPVNLIGTDSKYYWPHVIYSLLRCILCKYT